MKTKIYLFSIFIFLSLNLLGQEKTLKILAIGNSFSEDAIENYLSELARETNQSIVIGNLYVGGASLDYHINSIKENKAPYSYRKIKADGTKTTQKNVRIADALQDEDWDYISLQQASPYSGQYTLIEEKLPILMAQVQEMKPQKAKFIYHQTWAYQQDSPHKGFANYDNNQLKMYQAINEVSKKISKSKQVAFVVPSGTAIQNARTSPLGDTFTRDGYHLNLDYGRFTAACTWYEKLFGLDVRKNSYVPTKVSAEEAKIAKEAAHKAVKSPHKISIIKP